MMVKLTKKEIQRRIRTALKDSGYGTRQTHKEVAGQYTHKHNGQLRDLRLDNETDWTGEMLSWTDAVQSAVENGCLDVWIYDVTRYWGQVDYDLGCNPTICILVGDHETPCKWQEMGSFDDNGKPKGKWHTVS